MWRAEIFSLNFGLKSKNIKYYIGNFFHTTRNIDFINHKIKRSCDWVIVKSTGIENHLAYLRYVQMKSVLKINCNYRLSFLLQTEYNPLNHKHSLK